jgi:hypothetical protein
LEFTTDRTLFTSCRGLWRLASEFPEEHMLGEKSKFKESMRSDTAVRPVTLQGSSVPP